MPKQLPRKPRIVLLMQFYDPEPVYKGQHFAEAIAKYGYDVEVVTGFPNYPGGKVYKGYRIRPIERSNKNGVRITRLALYPSHDRGMIGRSVNYASFAISSFIYLTFFLSRVDLVYVYSPPVTVGLAATMARFFRRFPVVVDIHDLWPDTLPATGMLTNARILKLVGCACNWMYRHVQHIILHSNGFRERLLERGVSSEKMTTIIGWTNEAHDYLPAALVPESMRRLRGLKVLYAGNIGPAQALCSVLEAAQLLQESGAVEVATFCILGSGVLLDDLRARVSQMELDNVVFLPRVSPTDARSYLAAADVLLVHLRDDPIFAITLPSKTQSYMLAGRPILMAVRGEAATLIERAKGGLTVPPENPKALADAVRKLWATPTEVRSAMGDNARNYYWQYLNMEKGVAKFNEIFSAFRPQ